MSNVPPSPIRTPIRTAAQLGEALRRARKSAGLSQAALADLAGLRAATLSALENGASNAQAGTILAVMAALNLELRVQPRDHDTPDFDALF